MRRANYNRVTFGGAILNRFEEVGVPPALKDDHAAFAAQHGVFVKASDLVAKREAVYDDRVKSVALLDAKRDKTTEEIADEMPAAGLGTRNKPFGRFSKLAPTKITGLPYAAETLSLRSLFSDVLAAKPSAEIAKLCKRGQKENEAVDAALTALTAPLASLNEARAQRDATIPDWEKRLRRLQDSAKVAYRDVTGRYDALFAEPEAVQLNVRAKPRKAKGEGAQQDGAAAPAAPVKKAKKRARRPR